MKKVTDFGALGDGITDDTSSVQAAIDASSNEDVHFPSGRYLCGSLTLKPGIRVTGEFGSVIVARDDNQSILSFTTGTYISRFFEFIGLRFENGGKTGVTGIRLDGNASSYRVSYIRIIDCNFSGLQKAVSLRYCANTYIDRLFITACSYGIYIDVCADTDIHNTKIQNGDNFGIYINGGDGAFDEGMRLVGVSTNGQNKGIGINGQPWGIATGCSITTCPGGALIVTGPADNWKFLGCEFGNAGSPISAPGVQLSSSTVRFQFLGCFICLNTFGMVLRGSQHIVKGNNFSNNTNVDIYLDSCSKSVIEGNVCDSSSVSWSILENGSDQNSLTGNVTNGTVTKNGANSLATDNIQY